MFCSGCGNQLRDGAAFCDKCGKAIARKTPQAPNNYASEVRNPAPVMQTPPAAVNYVPPAEQVNQKETKDNSKLFGLFEIISVSLLALSAILLVISCYIKNSYPAFILIPAAASAVTAAVFTVLKYSEKNKTGKKALKNGIVILSLVSVSSLCGLVFLLMENWRNLNGFFYLFIAGLFALAAYINMEKSKESRKGSLLGICLTGCSVVLYFAVLLPSIRILFNRGSFHSASLMLYVLFSLAFTAAMLLPLVLDSIRHRFYTSGNSELFTKSGSIGGFIGAGAVLIGLFVMLCCTTFIGFNIYSRNTKELDMSWYGHKRYEDMDLAFASTKDLIRLNQLEKLNFSDAELNNEVIEDISKCTGLKKIDIVVSKYLNADYSSFSNLTNLEYLNIKYTGVSDISFVASMRNLKYLYIYGCNASDVSALENCTELEELCLCYVGSDMDGNIYDLYGLRNLRKLKKLCIREQNVSDISPLEKLTSLEYLCLNGNSIENISPLRNLNELKELSICQDRCRIDISELEELSELEVLSLDGYLDNIESIVYLPNLEEVNLSYDCVWEETLGELKAEMPDCSISEGYGGGFDCCTPNEYD